MNKSFGVQAMNRIKFSVMLFLFLGIVPAALAQNSCPAIVQTALDAADELCANTGRNQACYGHIALSAVAQPTVTDFRFEQVGDVTDVSKIQSLRLNPMDVAADTWGVVVMRLQANLPDSLPGQNVTFLLFGDVEITNAVTPDTEDHFTPMQAFLLRTGIEDAQCAEAPSSGVLVQTPEGVSEVAFNVNGVDVSMGSTVLFRAQAEGDLTISTLEGSAFVESEENVIPILAGTRLNVPIDIQLRIRPNARLVPEPYELRRLRGLPLRLLQRRIDINRPLTPQDMRELQRRLLTGEPICGEEPFPSCDHVPRRSLVRLMRAGRERLEGRLQCVFRRFPNEQPLPANESRPFCDTLPPDTLPCVFLPGSDQPPLPENERRPFCPQLPPDSKPSNSG
jgi:hypothetical protein